MKAIVTIVIPILAIMACAAPLRAEAAVQTNNGSRQVAGIIISVAGGEVTLSWDEVAGATAYKVYSSAAPELEFVEDSSGSFSGTSWTAPLAGDQRFYHVTSLSSGGPAGMIYVAGGTFNMGDTRNQGAEDEEPVHVVTLSPFYIGEFEVTQSEWIAVMGPWNSDPEGDGVTFGVGDNYPVHYISWYATLKYCNLRSLAEGLTPVYAINGSSDPDDWGAVPTGINAIWDAATSNWTANGYRLPTEAEWEYAARGATNNPDFLYSGSDDVNAVAWNVFDYNNPYGSKPVGTKAANGLGIHDMSGNIHEWCWDSYSPTYYSESPQNNPTGPAGSIYGRVSRGGSWIAQATYCRVTERNDGQQHRGYYTNGFRVSRAAQ